MLPALILKRSFNRQAALWRSLGIRTRTIGLGWVSSSARKVASATLCAVLCFDAPDGNVNGETVFLVHCKFLYPFETKSFLIDELLLESHLLMELLLM